MDQLEPKGPMSQTKFPRTGGDRPGSLTTDGIRLHGGLPTPRELRDHHPGLVAGNISSQHTLAQEASAVGLGLHPVQSQSVVVEHAITDAEGEPIIGQARSGWVHQSATGRPIAGEARAS